ncbi:MAG: hypothetical protein KME23_18015 [Goleter apudmare HA4340-LM2]|jgi:hypothetical protein|nr:hypothetical protein [Goleter apudmare HA4340-LM2]
MSKPTKLNWRCLRRAWPTCISNIYQKIVHGMCFFPVIYFFYWTLWIGKPNQIICQNIDLIRVDCTLRYQGILRSSEQKVKNVQDVDIDIRMSHSEGTTTTSYVAVLRSDGSVTDIKTYFNRNDPELQILNNRLTKFLKNTESKVIIPIDYNPWSPIFISIYIVIFLCLFLLLSIVMLTFVAFIFGAISQLFT